ncbi:MAG: arylsulfatase, partial [Kiritimatiellae bacterium]|nr:arylsulfatase [Kiritimatiellia bacterium]
AERPNIIVILSDDMGFTDIGCYGSEIETPALDGLAANGMKFTQFYNTGRCCPTRASLLTGLYPHQTGLGHMTASKYLEPGYVNSIGENCVTMAQVLKTAGYRNYHVGKWHVFKESDSSDLSNPNFQNWPKQRGFDRNYTMLSGAGSFFDPKTMVRDNTRISVNADKEYEPETYYFTDAISDNAVTYIKDHQQQHRNKPFFIYVAYTAAHWPMHALPKDIAKYKGHYDAGYDAVRKARYAKAKKEGVIGDESVLTPTVGDWANVKNREWELRCMEVYAAMVDNMDQGIGRIVGTLKSEKIFDNTLICFMQDNGGCAEGMGRRARGKLTSRADKPTKPPMKDTDLQMGMIPSQTRDGYPLLMGPGVMPGPADTYIGYGRDWANVSNTPFREYKHWVHEGGVATPMILSYPDGVSKTGSIAKDPGHLIDIMATCVDYAGATYPTEFAGKTITPMQGVSLRPVLEGKALNRGKPVFFAHEGNSAIREGRWKLVAKKKDVKADNWELYDMQVDRSETNNLAAKHPERTADMKKRWYAWAIAEQVFPSIHLGEAPPQ